MTITVQAGVNINGNVVVGTRGIEQFTTLQTNVVTFTSNTTWTPPADQFIITGTMLLVAGGGAGQDLTYTYAALGDKQIAGAAGGGAGGVVANVDITSNIASWLGSGSYTITVGTGGRLGALGVNNNPGYGNNSAAFGYTALGGGSSSLIYTPFASGSGSQIVAGTSSGWQSSAQQITANTQGSNGAAGFGSIVSNVAQGSAGGGGGFASAGKYGTGLYGTGGDGLVSNISGANVTYATGGWGPYISAALATMTANGLPSNSNTYATWIYGTPPAAVAGSGGNGGASILLANTTAGFSGNFTPTPGGDGICVIKYTYIQKNN